MIRRYRHTCEISEIQRTEEGEFVTTIIYSGECNYQDSKRSMVSGNIVITSPRLYLPENDTFFNIGNQVKITLEKGRVIESEIDNVRDKSGDKIKGTKIELKQAQNN